MASTHVQTTPETRAAGSRLTLRGLQYILVIAALLVTGYMTYSKLAGVPLQCADTEYINCSAVEGSVWAEFMGIPTALLGFLAHLAIGAILVLETRQQVFKDYGVMMLFGITLFGVLYHAYLTYVSATIIKALCPYCLTAFGIMILQLIISSVRLKRTLFA